ncbi:hypothetical protein [Bacillus sp. FJAT-45350]|uniref:hypothetical protein n=1 Tax=Bacillus sp. FJAT-45350 TaxID=2011014 RepID=UPI000BB920EA|nr:hypothetical protein [Bacillus sp. FJAT-45350]
MLTFEEKLSIIESFPELERKDVSLGRVNFHFDESSTEKKNVVYHLHPNGNGFIFAKHIKGQRTDSKGMVNIREYSEEELRSLISKAIVSLTSDEEVEIDEKPVHEDEYWINNEKQTLRLTEEYEMWNVYGGDNLDGTFPSYNEAIQYLDEEGFRRK